MRTEQLFGGNMYQVDVQYRYGYLGTAITRVRLSLKGKSESAILAEIHRRYPTHNNIVLLEIKWH